MEKTQLALEITAARMSAFRLKDGSVTQIVSLSCTNRSDNGYQETLQELIANCGNPDLYDTFSCSYSQDQTALVPMMLFGESKPELILNLTSHRDIPKDEIDYNRLPEWNIVNVYRVPMWIKSVLVMKIPRVVIQHELSHVLRFMNTGSTIPLRTQIIIQEGHFCMVTRKDGQIAHSSYQSYQSAEDILYHLLYTYQQLDITSKGEIFLQTATEELKVLAEQVNNLAKSVALFQPQVITTHFQEHLKFQTLCV